MKPIRTKVVQSAGIRILQAGLGVATSLVLAAWLGPAQFGRYAFALTVATILAVFAQTGWPTVLTREVAKSSFEKSWARLRGVIRSSNRMVMLCSLAGATACVLAGVLVARWLPEQDAVTVALAGLLVPLYAFAGIRGAALRGLGRVISGQSLDAAVRPAAFLLMLGLAFASGAASPRSAMLMQATASLVAVLLGVALLRRSIPEPARTVAPETDPGWRASLWPLTFVSGMQIISSQIDLVFLGMFATATDTGHYKVAAAVSAQVAFAAWPINAVFAPHIVKLHAAGDRAGLAKLIRRGSRYSLLVGVPVVALVVGFGRFGLERLVGAEYAPAYLPMCILAVGQLLAVSAGPVGLQLAMTGGERLAARAVTISLMTGLVLYAVLVPRFGTIGAAIGTATSLVTMRLLLLRYARRQMGEGG